MARVVVTGTMTAGFAGVEGTGRPFRIDQAVIAHLRDGRVVEAGEIADMAALRDQVTGGYVAFCRWQAATGVVRRVQQRRNM